MLGNDKKYIWKIEKRSHQRSLCNLKRGEQSKEQRREIRATSRLLVEKLGSSKTEISMSNEHHRNDRFDYKDFDCKTSKVKTNPESGIYHDLPSETLPVPI